MELYKYQKDIVKRVDISNNNGIMLYMDMGTGKTITSLAICKKIIDEKSLKDYKIHIFCLASKKKDWENETIQLGICSLVKSFESITTKKLDTLLAEFDTKNHHIIILDESHKAKNLGTVREKFFTKLKKQLINYNFLCLTGTPENKGYLDLFMSMYLCNILDDKYGNKTKFKDHFCEYELRKTSNHSFLELKGYKNTKILDEKLNNDKRVVKYIIAKKDKSYNVEICKIKIENPNILTWERELKRKKVLTLQNYEVICDSLSKLRYNLRTLDHIQHIIDTSLKLQKLEELLITNDRCIVFYNYNVELDDIMSIIQKHKITYSLYNGNNHRLDSKSSIYICQTQAVSHGLNCFVEFGINIGIFYSLPDSFIDYSQSIKRLDRIGQTKDVSFYLMYNEQSIDNAVLDKLLNKKSFTQQDYSEYLQ